MTKLYSILDSKAGIYGPLLSFQNDSTAIRSFQEMLVSGDSNSLLALYPTDYLLYCVGDFQQDKGVVTGSLPTLVLTGLEACTKAIDEVQRRKRFREQLSGASSSDLPNANYTPGDQLSDF